MVRETELLPRDLIWPLFVAEGRRAPVASMPGVDRLSIDEVVREALMRHLPRADSLGVDLGARGLDAPVPVLAQRALFEGVLDNLIDNALRYGRPADDRPARVTVEVVHDMQGGVRLSVADNGPGIDDAQRQRLLTRWAQGPAGETLRQGAGLGLAIVAEYARILGATLSLEAGEEGCGLRVSLLFQPSVG